MGIDILPYIAELASDPSPQVRRECALALRHNKSPRAAELWAELALKHDGRDRWYLEALGISADRQWDSFFAEWLKRAGADWNSPAGRDIVWRSRAKDALPLLAKLILDPATSAEDRLRYFRAFDFHTDSSKLEVLSELLAGHHPQQATINILATPSTRQMVPEPKSANFSALLDGALNACRGTDEFVDLVAAYHRTDRANDLLAMALANSDNSLGVRTVKLLAKIGAIEQFKPALADDKQAAKALLVLGLSQDPAAIDIIRSLVLDGARAPAVRCGGVEALGRSHLGQLALLELATKGTIAVELQFAAAKIFQSSDRHIQAKAAKFLKVPEPTDDKPPCHCRWPDLLNA